VRDPKSVEERYVAGLKESDGKGVDMQFSRPEAMDVDCLKIAIPWWKGEKIRCGVSLDSICRNVVCS